MKVERIRYRPAERQALVEHRAQAFCLTSGDLRAAHMAELYLSSLDGIARARTADGPFLCAVSPRGLRLLDLT